MTKQVFHPPLFLPEPNQRLPSHLLQQRPHRPHSQHQGTSPDPTSTGGGSFRIDAPPPYKVRRWADPLCRPLLPAGFYVMVDTIQAHFFQHILRPRVAPLTSCRIAAGDVFPRHSPRRSDMEAMQPLHGRRGEAPRLAAIQQNRLYCPFIKHSAHARQSVLGP